MKHFNSSSYCYLIIIGSVIISAIHVQNSPTNVKSGRGFDVHGGEYKKVLYHRNKTSKSYSSHVAQLYRLNGPLYT